MMGYIIALIAGFILGRKYQELMDLMMARRIARMVQQREQVQKDVEAIRKYEDELEVQVK